MVAASHTVKPGKRPPKAHPFLPRRLQAPIILVWLRRSHGWLGVWGAVAGILFGLTTIAMVHSDLFPAEPESRSIVQLPVDGAIINSVDDLGAFAKAELGLKTEWRQPRNRGGGAGGATPEPDEGTSAPTEVAGTGPAASAAGMGAMSSNGRRSGGAAGARSNQPVFVTQFTSPQRTLDLRYVAGNEYIEITRTERGFFSTLNRLHLAANTGPVWVGIIDAFSGALVVFSVTGLLLWSRLTGPRLLAIGLAGSMLLATVYYAAIL